MTDCTKDHVAVDNDIDNDMFVIDDLSMASIHLRRNAIPLKFLLHLTPNAITLIQKMRLVLQNPFATFLVEFNTTLNLLRILGSMICRSR